MTMTVTTNRESGTRVDEVAAGLYRISTPVPPAAMPGGFSFNQYLLADDESLGHCRHIDDDRRIFYMSPTGAFAVTKPINGAPATAANGGTVGFVVADPATVDAWHAAGVANGGTTCEEPPGVREGGLGKMYLAYLRDPSGNKLCALHRMG